MKKKGKSDQEKEAEALEALAKEIGLNESYKNALIIYENYNAKSDEEKQKPSIPERGAILFIEQLKKELKLKKTKNTFYSHSPNLPEDPAFVLNSIETNNFELVIRSKEDILIIDRKLK